MRNILSVSLVLILFLGVCNSYALDNITCNSSDCNKTTDTQNNSVIYVSLNGDDGNDGSTEANAKRTIQCAINTVADNGTVYVDNGTYHENLKINKNMSLIGTHGPGNKSPIVLDGDYKNSCMVIEKNADVYLRWFIMCHGLSAGIINHGKVYLSVNSITDNIVGIENTGKMEIDSTTIANNKNNGVINSGNLAIYSGDIINNINDGIINNGNLNLLYFPMVSGNRNGIINNGNLTLSKDSKVFDNNHNGIINSGSLTITNSYIHNNGDSGIVNSGDLTFNKSFILDNKNIGINNTGASKIIDSPIQRNKNVGISNEGTLTFSGSLIQYSKEAVNNFGTLHIIKSQIQYNNKPINNFGTLHIIKSQILYNEERYLSASYIYNKNILTINDSLISHNTGYQNGIRNGYNCILNITNSKIHANDAVYGGGITNSGFLNLVSCEITNNYAGTEGGGICNWGDAVIINTTIRNNKADDEGGGIKSYDSLDIINSTISGNKVGKIFPAKGYGGGINAEGNLKVTNCKINDNTAGEGGGIYRKIGSYALLPSFIVDSKITGNIANKGGGIYHRGSLILENVKINDNFAWKGGGIYNTNGDIYKYDQTEIEGNWFRNICMK